MKQFTPKLLRLRPWLIAAVAAALGVHYFAQADPLAPTPKASVSAQRLEVSPDGASAQVVLRVAAGAEDLGPLSVFWIVSLPDTERPWEEPRYLAPAQTLASLKAGTTADLTWQDTQLTMPIGHYDVTGWVHEILAPGQTQHLAGGPVGSFSITRPEPQSAHFDAGWFSEAKGPLTLQTLSITQVAPQTQTVSVEATVLNSGAEAASGQAFWLVSRFTDPEPYLAPFWQSATLTIPMLAPGESQVLSWTQSIGLPAGLYGLSMWVHWDGPAGSVHSQASLNIPLTLAPDVTHVERHGPPGSTQVASATLAQPGLLRVVLDNQGPAVNVSLAADVMPEGRRYDWYRERSEPAGPLMNVSIPGDAQVSLDVPVAVDCTPDNARVRLRLYLETAPPPAGAPVDDSLVDACP